MCRRTIPTLYTSHPRAQRDTPHPTTSSLFGALDGAKQAHRNQDKGILMSMGLFVATYPLFDRLSSNSTTYVGQEEFPTEMNGPAAEEADPVGVLGGRDGAGQISDESVPEPDLFRKSGPSSGVTDVAAICQCGRRVHLTRYATDMTLVWHNANGNFRVSFSPMKSSKPFHLHLRDMCHVNDSMEDGSSAKA
jgi:hypothetical protein